MITRENASFVLIGSGPSLKNVDLRPVARFPSIAFNRSFVAWPSWGFAPRYYACLDPESISIVGPELPEIIEKYPQTHFFLHESIGGVPREKNIQRCKLGPGECFGTTLEKLTDFGNVGATSMQIVAALGYRKVVMIGVDGHYVVDQAGAGDPNHFRQDYAPVRAKLTASNVSRYSAGWSAVAAECERLGVEVRNCSPGSRLAVFPKLLLEAGLSWINAPGDDAIGTPLSSGLAVS